LIEKVWEEGSQRITVLNATEGDSCGIDGCDQTAYNMDNINTICQLFDGVFWDVTERKVVPPKQKVLK
jgi:hypothetical protein